MVSSDNSENVTTLHGFVLENAHKGKTTELQTVHMLTGCYYQ